ncbi:putative F-box/LRR-repeat protein At1g56400 [Macadamia integrifolia]|uniref:putative F-box/LRR-repeat protein At1g56400 n=1 Tax=Macadamia integrifolia TaxID=60698 RepID=UPI001C4E57BB|nr:putative F-box/LRR-repeat protein At1g56400 [Macadamia integrifolia]
MADNRENTFNITHFCLEVVTLIISFLSLPDAMNLCSLHRSWSNLWSHCRIIDLNENTFSDVDEIHRAIDDGDEELAMHLKHIRRSLFIKHVRWVLPHLQSHFFSKFSLRIWCEPEHHELIEDWIRFATERNVEELSLDFSDEDPCPNIFIRRFTMPKFFYSFGGSIKSLSLNSCYLREPNFQTFILLTKVSFTSIDVSMVDVLNLVTNSPLLEDLSLVQCYKIFSLVLGFTCLNLKRLVVKDCGPLSFGISLHVPNLRYFEFAGGLISIDLTQLHSIEEAVLDYGVETVDHYNTLGMKYLIRGLKQARKLKLCSYVHKVLPSNYCCFYYPSLQLKNLVHLTLKTFVQGYELPGIICLLALVPNLRTLSIMSGYIRSMNDFFCFDFPSMPDGFWRRPTWPLNCLEIIQMIAFSAHDYEIELLNFLLRNGLVLQKVIIKPKEASDLILQAILGLQNVPKASETVQIAYELIT